jgi:hypothetical protein
VDAIFVWLSLLQVPSVQQRHGLTGFVIAPTAIIGGLGISLGLGNSEKPKARIFLVERSFFSFSFASNYLSLTLIFIMCALLQTELLRLEPPEIIARISCRKLGRL